jgi:hypothetical protein
VGERGVSFPDLSHGSPYVPLIAETDDERSALLDWSSIIDEDLGRGERRHQLLGYPRGSQRDTLKSAARGFLATNGDTDAVNEEARRLRLILQLGEDEEAGLQWADGGNIAFIARPDDLAAARFVRSWASTELG